MTNKKICRVKHEDDFLCCVHKCCKYNKVECKTCWGE